MKLRETLNDNVMDLLVRVSEIMTNEDRADKILPIILDNIRDDGDEDKRIMGLILMDRLAMLLGKDICQNYLMHEIVSLQDDSVYRVRRETVLKIINISKVLGKDIFLRLLFPVYKKLSSD